MSVSVKFYVFSKKTNSTARPSGNATEYPCVIKDTCSLISPTLIIDTGSAAAPLFNYCYIQAFGRYYWVTSWTWVKGLWEASLSVDALASWKSQIGASTQYVLRSASQYDLYIKDDMYPMTSNISRSRTAISDILPATVTSGTFIIGIIGDNQDTFKMGSVCYYAMTSSMLNDFVLALFKDDIWSELVTSYVNPIQYIVSCNWIPVHVGSATNTSAVKLGHSTIKKEGETEPFEAFNLTFGNSTQLKFKRNITLPKHPQEARGKYLNLSPYSVYQLLSSAFGTINLEASNLVDDSKIDIYLNIDIVSGKGKLTIYGHDSGKIIQENIAQVSIPIQLAQITAFSAGEVAGVVSSVAGVVANLAMGNVAGAIVGSAGAISSVVNASQESVQKSGASGSLLNFVDGLALVSTFTTIADENLDHRGRPLCKEKVINTLSGYILCSDSELSLPATQEESDMIKNYMEGGFFYE